MATYTLPNPSGQGSITVAGNSLSDAQNNAAAQYGMSSWTGGSYGSGSNPAGGTSGPTADASGGGDLSYNPGAASLLQKGASDAAQQAYYNALLQQKSEAQAFTEAQQAFTNAMAIGTAYGTSPGGTYNGMALPAKGTPTMAQMQQWANMYGTAAAPANQYQMTLAAQQQQFQQQQAAAQQYAQLSGYYTPQGAGDVLGTVSGSVSMDQIDKALQSALGRDYNQSVFQSMTSGLQGQSLTTPQAMQQINNAIKTASQGRLDYASIAGSLPSGGYSQAPPQAQTQAAQLQQANLTGMVQYNPYGAGQWLYDPSTGTYGQVSANGQVRNFNSIDEARAAGMPTANWNNNQVDPARVMQTSSANNWGGIGQQQYSTAYQQQLFNQALNTAQFQQNSAMDYLKLLSTMSGPADYGNYLRTLAGTPQGIQSLVGAAAGQYVPGGGSTGVAPTPASLQSLVGSAMSGQGQPGGQLYAGALQGAQAPGTFAAGQFPTQGAMQRPGAGQGQIAPGNAGYMDMMQPQGQGYGQVPGSAGSATTYQDFINQAQRLPAPGQLAPQSYANMTPSQKGVLQSMYTNLGYNADDVSAMFKQSLPTYAAGGGQSTGSFKLV